jgi:hypothetical protein
MPEEHMMVKPLGMLEQAPYQWYGGVDRFIENLTNTALPWRVPEAGHSKKDHILLRPGQPREQTYDTFGEEMRHRMQMGDGGSDPSTMGPESIGTTGGGGGWGENSELDTMFDRLQGLRDKDHSLRPMTGTAISPAQAMDQRTPGYRVAATGPARQNRIDDPGLPIDQDISDRMMNTPITSGTSPAVTGPAVPAQPGQMQNYANNTKEIEAKTAVQKEAYYRQHGHIPSPEQFQGWLNKQRKEGGFNNDPFWNHPDASDPNSEFNKRINRTLPKVVDNNNLHQNMWA